MLYKIKEILANIESSMDSEDFDHECVGLASGVNCCYFKLNDKFGLKVFPNYNLSSFSFEENKRAALDGYGTFIYDTFTSKRCTGVLVEHVMLIRHHPLFKTEYEKLYSIMGDFESKLGDMFCSNMPAWLKDIHSGNVGFRGDKMVCLDFSS